MPGDFSGDLQLESEKVLLIWYTFERSFLARVLRSRYASRIWESTDLFLARFMLQKAVKRNLSNSYCLLPEGGVQSKSRAAT